MGVFFFWASRAPLKHLSLVWLVIWLEVIRGIADNIYLMAKGYGVASYAAFCVPSLIIIITGIIFARQVSHQTT